MAQAIAATVPSEVAARKLAEWLSKIIHRVNVATTGNQWSIFVPEAALSRARRALREVIVAANPPPRPGGACCKALGTGAPCAKCGKHAHFTVDWIIPSRVPDTRPACSSACAAALKKSVASNTDEKRYNVWAYNRLTGGSFALERNVTAKVAVKAYREARKQGLRPWCIDLTTRNEVHPTRSGALPNPVNKRARREARRREQRLKEDLGLSGRPLARPAQWTGGQDAYGQGQRSGKGYVRFWLWNDREWKLNLRSSYEGVGGEPSLRESAKFYADEEAHKKGIAAKFPSQVGKWKAGFVLAFEKAIAAAFGPKREFDDEGLDKGDEQANRLWRRRQEHRKKFAGKNPSAESAWAKLNERQRIHALEFAGFEWSAAKRYGATRWGLLPRVFRDRLTASLEAGASRGTTRRLQAVRNPSNAVRLAREAKVKQLLIRIKAILQAGEQKLRSGRRQEALESMRRVEALWDQMPKGVAMVSPRTRREAFELSQRGVRLRNGQVGFNKRRAGRNAGERYLIQGIRPKHRNWVTIDYAHDLNRALLNALHRARLGNVTYRVWDTEKVEEVWRGTGQEATIEGWKATRPSGLVGANRRTAMHRNPRLSPKMMKLRENTMRLGDAMKWGRRLLDAGVRIHLWDGSGWEVDIRPDDSFSTSNGRSAAGGRAYLARGAGLIKTWPITLLAPEMKPGYWLTTAAISHYLAHRKMGVASNPRACANPLCKAPQKRSVARNAGAAPNVLVRGDRLPHNLQLEVLRRFIYRWTKDNSDRARVYHCPVCKVPGGDPNGGVPCRQYHPTMPLQTDAQWLKEHAFHVTKDMSRLMHNRRHAEPSYMAKENPRRASGLRPKRVGIYCRMCGEWDPAKGPYKPATGAGWMTGKLACLDCRKGIAGLKRAKYDFVRHKMPGKRTTRRNQGDAGDNPRIAHEEIVGAFLAGRSKKIGPRYWTDGNLLRVWGNLVAKKVPGGVDIMDAGWRTLLTRNVLNTVLRHLGGGSIFQSKHQWYISTPQGKVAWPGEWTIPTGGAAANRGRRVRRNGRGENLTIADIEQWVNNDEGLYRWWKGSRTSLRNFVRENRAELERLIQAALNKPPAQKTWRDYAGMNPRIRAWNVVAFLPGEQEGCPMASNIKDKQRAVEIAKVYNDIARKERRKHKYVVEPFRYSDWRTRLPKKSPLRNPGSNAWNVYLDGKLIDTVFYSASARVTADEVKRSLVNHDGYDSRITVRRSNRFAKKNPLTRRESARLIRAARGFMAQGRSPETPRKERHYRFGQASGIAAAVQVAGPRRAEIPAAMVRGRAMKAHRVSANPHAGLKGLMNKGAARNAQRFARI
jgi:hypothetical protein